VRPRRVGDLALPQGASSTRNRDHQQPARHRARGSAKRSTEWTGYKVHLTETCDPQRPHLITQVETTHATLTDFDALPLVQTGLDTAGRRPGEHYLDAGYATTEAIARAEAGTEIIGPVSLDTSWQAKAGRGYDRAGFQIDWDRRHGLCPQGKTSTSWHDAKHPYGTGVRIGFAAADCAACPARALCTRSEYAGRHILLQPRVLHEIQRRNRSDQNGPGRQRRYNTRAGIEGTMSEGVRGYGLRRCRHIGLDKTRVQHVLAACGMNAARIAHWDERDGQAARPRRGSRLKALCKKANTSRQPMGSRAVHRR
jgi:transposase